VNAEIAKKWVAALRSGEYRQSKSQLRRGDGFCCLGVLCELAAKEGVGQWNGTAFTTDRMHMGGDFVDFVNHRDVHYLPHGVTGWACVQSKDPQVLDDNNGKSHLSELNDNGFTFDQIATIIEKQAEML
jgi:hypothetical protein